MPVALKNIKWKELPSIYPWLRHYRSAKYRCAAKDTYCYKKGIKFRMSEEDFKFLWFRDKAWTLKRASIDRIKNNLNYTLKNCRFIELSKNVCKDNTGSLNVDAKLNEEKVYQIKEKYASGLYTQRQLANEYRVSQGCISGILQRLYWKHVSHEPEIIERSEG